ncbi:MAG TPA: tRNA lysidine(34) synthetase TilS [Deltaproteobacteria bacterium]|nr:tRNA lysidine(34) synthetase TilS [Deltaproteobacteria bacterium]
MHILDMQWDKTMLNQVKKTIERFNMLKNGDRVLVAVSGGADSVVLLHVLMEIKDKYSLDIAVVHLNHSMRGEESDRDFVFVKNLAERIGVRFIGKKINVPEIKSEHGGSPQEVARRVRYRFFEDVAREYNADKIATGHTLDDQAETVIMRFIKGTSLRGMSGIPFVRGKFIRPLLNIKREDIESYAKANNIKFVEDSSNISTKYFRNKVRLELLPLLKKYNPKIKEEIARLAESASRDEYYLEKEAEKEYKTAIAGSTIPLSDIKVVFNLEKIKSLHTALTTRIFLKAIEHLKQDLSGIYSYHVEDIIDLIEGSAPQGEINLPMGITVYKEYEKLVFARERIPVPKSFETVLNIPGVTSIDKLKVQIKTSILTVSKSGEFLYDDNNIAYFDYDKLVFPVMARSFRAGDRFTPFGMKGSKKVKDLFIEKKVPFYLRRSTPIIASGDDLIWVAGIRRGDKARVEEGTKKVLKIEIIRTS